MTKRDLGKAGRENWVQDDSADRCSTCSAEFGLLTRRHHCRVCGHVFCWSCCRSRIRFTPLSRANEEGYTEKRKRACEACYNSLSEARAQEAKIVAKVTLAREEALALQAEVRRLLGVSVDAVARFQVQLEQKDGQVVDADDIKQFLKEYKWESRMGKQPQTRDYYKWQKLHDGCAADGPHAAQEAFGNLGGHLEDTHRFVCRGHTHGITVHAWGATRTEAFAQSCVGMFGQLTELDRIELHRCVEVEATGHDLRDLLHNLLDQLLLVFDLEAHVCRRVEVVELDEASLRIRARGYGERMDSARHEQHTVFKAISMHTMRILGPDSVITRRGAAPRSEVAQESRPGFPHEVCVHFNT